MWGERCNGKLAFSSSVNCQTGIGINKITFMYTHLSTLLLIMIPHRDAIHPASPSAKTLPLMYCPVQSNLVFTVTVVAGRVLQKMWGLVKRGVLVQTATYTLLLLYTIFICWTAYHYYILWTFHPLYTFYRFMNIVRKAISWTVGILLHVHQSPSVHTHFWLTPMALTTPLVQCKVNCLSPLELFRNSHRGGCINFPPILHFFD